MIGAFEGSEKKAGNLNGGRMSFVISGPIPGIYVTRQAPHLWLRFQIISHHITREKYAALPIDRTTTFHYWRTLQL